MKAKDSHVTAHSCRELSESVYQRFWSSLVVAARVKLGTDLMAFVKSSSSLAEEWLTGARAYMPDASIECSAQHCSQWEIMV